MQATCPYCETRFTKRRRDQKFCKAGCRSLFGQRKDRAKTPVNATLSPTKHRSNLELFDRMLFLTERYYRTPIGERLGLLSDLVTSARDGNFNLRAVLINPYLIDTRKTFAHDLLRRHRFPKSIGKIVDLYCQYFWNASGHAVICGIAPEPDTGVVVVDANPELERTRA